MSNFAEIDANGYVINVLRIPDEYDDNYLDYINNACGLAGTFVSANPTSANWAAQGMKYYPNEQAFLPSAPYPSWQIGSNNSGAFFWIAPVPCPIDEDGRAIDGYTWDEDSVSWKLALSE
jgi:hypothetical protein